MLICAGNNESFSFATSIGVGLIQSAINLTKLCIEENPKELIFIGSAGSYGKYKLFDILQAKQSSNIELAFLENNCYTPIKNLIKFEDDFNKDEVLVNCSNYITTNMALVKKHQNYLKDIENMEFYSVLSVAQSFKIKARGIFIITNYTNEKAHKDFIKNHKTAMQKLRNYLKEKNII